MHRGGKKGRKDRKMDGTQVDLSEMTEERVKLQERRRDAVDDDSGISLIN